MSRPPKRQKLSQVEEVTFDTAARHEYLTGFHKRKQQRIKHAQEKAAEFEKAQKLKDRKEMREQRKKDLEKHVETFNEMMKQAKPGLESGSDSDSEDETVDEVLSNQNSHSESSGKPNDIQSHEDEYIDEDKFTTVTVKPMKSNGESDDSEGVGSSSEHERPEEPDGAARNAEKAKAADSTVKQKRIWTKDRPDSAKAKKKRKKFRYENKDERKSSRSKEKARNSLAAKERRQVKKVK